MITGRVVGFWAEHKTSVLGTAVGFGVTYDVLTGSVGTTLAMVVGAGLFVLVKKKRSGGRDASG